MGLRLIPKEEAFFDLFRSQASTVVDGAKLLKDLLEDYDDVEQKRLKIEKTESYGDEIAHKIMEKLNQTFITPMDREDIHALTCALDDILDYINATSQRLNLYRVTSVTEDAVALANIILRSSEELESLINNMENFKDIKTNKARWIEVNRLENEGDNVSRHAIAGLFEKEMNPVEVIKWKELYEYLEKAIDKCEDAANIIEAVTLKNC